MTLKGSVKINLINIYIPQAERPEEEKRKLYKDLEEAYKSE